ncbi:DUF4097 family beta strand repeat-containing protein [Enterococcus sp. LJL128]
MKKLSLTILGISSCFLLSGCQALGGQTSYHEKEYTGNDSIRTIELTDKNMTVSVVGVEENQPLTINYYENNYSTYDIEQKGNKLVMEKKEKSRGLNLFSYINFNFHKLDVVVEVPKDQIDQVKVKTTNAKIDAEDLNLKSADFETTNGKIELDSIAVSGKIHGQTTNGKIDLNDLTGKEAVFTTTNGKINFDDFSVSRKLELGTTNGAVKGSIIGNEADFKITSSTTNGKNSLNNRNSGEKELAVKTTNGKIAVDFTGND